MNIKLNLTSPSKEALAFAQKHEIRGVPTVIFLDSTGQEVLANFSGALPPEPYLQEMQDVRDFMKARIQYKKTPEDIPLNLKLAIAYLERKQLEKAQPMIQRLLKADPDNAQGYALQVFHHRALVYVAQGELETAEKDIQKVEAWDKEGKYLPDLYFRTGFELGNANQLDQAVIYFEKVYTKYPESDPADAARFYTGFSYFILQKDPQAFELLSDYTENGKDPQLRQYAQDQMDQLKQRMK